jgi:hypothetical protein
MGISATAKSKLSIGTVPGEEDDFDVATFAADTYKQVKNVENMGEFGSEAEVIVGKFIDQSYARKLKGTRDNGSMTIVVGHDASDEGQIALKAAEKTEFVYRFKVELNDKPEGGTNTIYYFAALVASAKSTLDEADNIVKTTFILAITGEVLEVPAAPSVTP